MLCLDLRDEAAVVRREVAPLAEEVRLIKENLQKVFGEQEEFRCQAVGAYSRAGSLAEDLKAEQSEAHGLRTQVGELKRDLDISIDTSRTLSPGPCMRRFPSSRHCPVRW